MAAKEYLICDGPSLDFNLGISYALLQSQFLLSTTYFDRSFIVVVDSLLMWTLTAVVAEGPRDAESWFRAETYYIRILNVSPVFAKSVFLITRRVFADWAFVESVICWQGALLPSQFLLRQTTYSDRSFIVVVDSLLMWTLTAAVAEGLRDAESWFRAKTYYIRTLNASPVFAESVFWWRGALLPSQFLLRHQFFAESVLLSQFLLTRQHRDSVRKRTIYV